MRRRGTLLCLVLLLLAGGLCIAWALLGAPPPKLVLRHGLPPAGGPTGRSARNSLGVEFVEVAPGYARVRWRILLTEGDWLGRICSRLGLDWGNAPKLYKDAADRWVEVREPFWVSTVGIDAKLAQNLPLPEGAPRPAWDADFTEWMRNTDGGAYREPTDDEIYFAAAHGVWPGHQTCRPVHSYRVYLLGRDHQGFEGDSAEISRFSRLGSTQKDRRVWRGPPLVWIRSEE